MHMPNHNDKPFIGTFDYPRLKQYIIILRLYSSVTPTVSIFLDTDYAV